MTCPRSGGWSELSWEGSQDPPHKGTPGAAVGDDGPRDARVVGRPKPGKGPESPMRRFGMISGPPGA